MAEYYSAELSQKVRRGMNETRQKGNFTGGYVPYGYKIIDKKVVINNEQADIVRLIYDRYANGVYVKDIIAELNKMGVLTNRGKPFAKNIVHKILQSEKYTGIYHYGSEVFTNIYPRIVSEQIAEIVKEKNEINRHGGRNPDVIYLLSKKIKCGYCGKAINGFTGTSKTGKVFRYYCCSGVYGKKGCTKKYVRKEALENLVIDALRKAFLDDSTIDILAEKILESNQKRIKNQSVHTLLQKELKQTTSSIANLLAAIEKGVVTSSTTQRLQELEIRQDELRTKIMVEQAKEKLNITKNEIINYIKKAKLSTVEKLTKMLIKEIILYDDKIEIICNYTNNKKGPDGDPRQDLLFYTDNVHSMPFGHGKDQSHKHYFKIEIFV